MDQTSQIGTIAPSKVVPLLSALNRVEECASALTMRLDPITNHLPATDSKAVPTSSSVTGRLQQLGDVLQYLLDNIEL